MGRLRTRTGRAQSARGLSALRIISRAATRIGVPSIPRRARQQNTFLAFFRAATFVFALVQMLSSPLLAISGWPAQLLLVVVGCYTTVKLFVPFRWFQNDGLTWLVLAVDAILCVVLVVTTGGLGSPFLLYSLNPVLTLGLFSHRRAAASAAGALTMAVAFAETFPALGLGSVYDGSILGSGGLVALYGMVCLLGAMLPFVVNTNISRTLAESATRDERRRLAGEMHDSLAQQLGYLRLHSRMARQVLQAGDLAAASAALEDLGHGIDAAYSSTRESIDALRGERLSRIGLIPALAEHAHEFGHRTGIRTEFRMADGQTHFSEMAELQILRVVQEAVANVGKHAGANELKIDFETVGRWTTISVCDDGCGFEPGRITSESGGHHVGIQVMKERVESLGGTVELMSAPGSGTRVVFRVPKEES